MNKEYIINNKYFSLGVSRNGGCITHFNYRLNDGKQFPIFRPTDWANLDLPFSVNTGLFPMMPVVNRIKKNAFPWDGKYIQLKNNLADPYYFLHGDGWLKEWKILPSHPDQIRLYLPLDKKSDSPFHYNALLTITLSETGLGFELTLTNKGESAMPFGIGLHPFFHLEGGSRVHFEHSGLWGEDTDYLPTDYTESFADYLNFNISKQVPDNWINNGYFSEQGLNATILHTNGISVQLHCEHQFFQVYKPKGRSNFICIEPQTQFVNAHNDAEYKSLTVLKPKESMTMNCYISAVNKS